MEAICPSTLRTLIQNVIRDLRYSLRNLRRSPGFASTAILTLAIGIGAVATVFSVVQSVLLKPFAFPQPDRLVIVRETSVVLGNAPGPDNYTHFENWKANAKAFADAALFQNGTYSIGNGSDHPAVVPGLSVTPGFFHTLGVSPLLGRAFVPKDAVENGEPVVILSWSAWQQYFRGDQSVIGKTLRSGGYTADSHWGASPRLPLSIHERDVGRASAAQHRAV